MTRISILLIIPVYFLLANSSLHGQKSPLRGWGVTIGIFEPGPLNAIVDVPGVKVGHLTIVEGNRIRTGVTAILPHGENIFQHKVPGAIHIGNGFGKLAGISQVGELGNIESPILLTNTLSIHAGLEGGIRYTLNQKANEGVRSVNIVVGETNDGYLNDIQAMYINSDHVIEAIERADTGNIQQGNIGAGTGTVAFGFKGGIGTSSRRLPASLGGYTIGVLVQANFGGVLEIAGVPIGKELGRYPFKDEILNGDGSCMIVVMTDAPVLARNLNRIAKRAMLGFGKTGGMSSNGSGDYVIAVSTAEELRISPDTKEVGSTTGYLLTNQELSPIFQATIEATEEAIINALLMAEDMSGKNGNKVESLDHDTTKRILRKYGRIN